MKMNADDIPVAKRLPEHEPLYASARAEASIHPDMVSPGLEGYFRAPAIWIGEAPGDTLASRLVPAVHNAVVVHHMMRCGIEAWALRNGLFLFDFSSWQRGPIVRIPGFTAPAQATGWRYPAEHAAAETKAEEIAILRARVMNVHQVSLAIAEQDLFSRSGGMGYPMTAWTTYKALYFTPHVHYMDDTENPNAIIMNMMDNKEGARRDKHPHRRVLEVALVQRSFEILDEILLHPDPSSLILIDSLFLAAMRYRDKAYGEAVTLGWTVCEQLISKAWKKHIAAIAQNDAERMPRDRREKLHSRDYTASMMIEGLELAGILDRELYRRLEIARKSRNKWAHDLRLPHDREAMTCMHAGQDLLKLVLNLKMRLSHSGRGGVPQWGISALPPHMRVKVREAKDVKS